MGEKRMVGNYTLLNSIYVGHKEIAICENQKDFNGERYLCCYIENVIVFERYTEALVSDDFAEIVRVYGERIASAAEEIIKENEKAKDKKREEDGTGKRNAGTGDAGGYRRTHAVG